MTRSPVYHRSSKIDRVLVVDDSPDNSFLIQAILKEEGYIIDIVDNGQDALDRIHASPPDLVLLDVMMPDMDGFEVTQRVRESERQQKLPFIPILLITAHDKPRAAQGLDTGADDFIRKPVEFDELLARVRSLLKLKHSVDERDQIACQREDFVSRLTHDLRTPLVAADRMLALFQQGVFGDLSEEMQEAIVIMARSNQNLLEMVNALLQVYTYEAGRKTLAFITVDLNELITEVIQALAPIAIDKGLELRTNLATLDQPLLMKGDRLEIRRVLTNLIGNAVKFTDAGWVEVNLSAIPNPSNKPGTMDWVKIDIADTGAGIAPDFQAHLFEPFRHGSHKRSGSGLGLNLSYQIIRAHGGDIDVKSEPGKGSVFTICFPVEPPEQW